MRLPLTLLGLLFMVSGLYSQFKVVRPYEGPKIIPDLSIPLILKANTDIKHDNTQAFSLPTRNVFPNIERTNRLIRKNGNRIKSIKRAIKINQNNDDAINAFFSDYQDIFNTNINDVSAVSTEQNDIRTTYRVKQQYKGIDIYGAQATLHGQTNYIDYYLGNFIISPSDLEVSPSFDKEEAWNKLHTKMPLEILALNVPQGVKNLLAKNVSTVSLVIYPSNNGDLLLTYHFIYFQDGIHKKEIFMNAHSGDIFRQFDAYCKLHNSHEIIENNMPPEVGQGLNLFNQNIQFNTWRDGSTYFLMDANRSMFNSAGSTMPNDPIGVIWTLSGNGRELDDPNFSVTHTVSASPNWSNPVAISAHQNAALAYEYYLNTFGRNSINGTGGNIVSIINVGNNLDNAFWNGQAMFYGNGGQAFSELARGLDVAGHEMSHGVVQSTANLEYIGESGALNESFADIFGAMIDRENWQIGEDVVNPNSFPSGALRSMSNPHNGGQSISDPGYQPQFYGERFTGSEDNGGVHINSGIINHAYYLFATNQNVGKSEAEQVFYKVLTQYLTRSSDFSDLRAAAEEVVSNDFGAQSQELAALVNAFNVTGVPGGGGQMEEIEFESNPGDEFVLVTNANLQGIFTVDVATDEVIPLSDLTIKNRPSVTDDGSTIVFVDGDGQLRFMQDFPSNLSVGFIEQTPRTIWHNVIISRDGRRLAATTLDQVNEINVFDLENGQSVTYTLFNPTFTTGVSTGDVLYSDAMEFDHSGEVILYDAFNRIRSTDGGTDIEYWDIGLLEVWDNTNTTFGSGNIQKLFNNLPANTSIGNPTFSKNSPTIVAFDLLQDDNWFVLGMNIETNDVQVIADNNTVGFPNYSTDDRNLVFDQFQDTYGNEQTVAVIALTDTKISAAGTPSAFITGGSRALWYANGKRQIVSSADEIEGVEAIRIFPNPTSNLLNVYVELSKNIAYFGLSVSDMLGKEIYTLNRQNIDMFDESIELANVSDGIYILTLQMEDKKLSHKIHITK